MTPKEKAKELVESYKYRLLPFITFQTQLTETDLLNKCKQCALIAVDEIINTGPLKMIDWGEIISDKPYWQEVKQEIEAL
jgi:hypothetical protein